MKNIKIVDANIVLRYLIPDNVVSSNLAVEILEKNKIVLLETVVMEVIFVLQKVYKITRRDIAEELLDFCKSEGVQVENEKIVLYAIKQYGIKNLDFVDLLLYSYHVHAGYEVITFDKDLNKLIDNLR